MQSSALIVLTIFAKIFPLLKSSDGNPLMGIQFQKSAHFSQDVGVGGATAAFPTLDWIQQVAQRCHVTSGSLIHGPVMLGILTLLISMTSYHLFLKLSIILLLLYN